VNVRRLSGPRLLVAGVAVPVVVVIVVTLLAASGGRPAMSRGQRWRQDIAYLASELPQVHVGGLLRGRRSAWDAIRQVLAGVDPVLAAALRPGRPPRGRCPGGGLPHV
jgi:hypothetical protein